MVELRSVVSDKERLVAKLEAQVADTSKELQTAKSHLAATEKANSEHEAQLKKTESELRGKQGPQIVCKEKKGD